MKQRISIVMIAWITVCTISLIWNLASDKKNHENLLYQGARAFFQQVVLTRSWNAKHGGVYVPVTEATVPNPFLDDPLRDVTTTEGLELTKINPAFMTRQIGDIAFENNSIRFHITSLNPIRPDNKADSWETEALQSFEEGAREYREFVRDDTESGVYRFMAPLITQKSCLQCQAKQGYQEGDIRGGISVTLSIKQKQTNWTIWASHIIAALAGAFGLLLFGRHIINNQKKMLMANNELQVALDSIKTLKGFIPICAKCKKIRDDSGFWEQLESYIESHSDALFSHGVCPECTEELYGKEEWYKKSKELNKEKE
jgi:Protein of unknown function (DUF3365)